jgi:hypothetical protein
MKSVNMNIMNCVLLVIIMVIVIFCCMNKSNEGFRSRQQCARALNDAKNIGGARKICSKYSSEDAKCCKDGGYNLFGINKNNIKCYDMCSHFRDTTPEDGHDEEVMKQCSNLSINDCEHPFYKHCKWKGKRKQKTCQLRHS